MADVHFKKHLIHQATVQRKTEAASDTGELIATWATNGTIYCRFIQKSERVAQPGTGFMMAESCRLLCNAGEDVIEEDRITSIILRSDSSSVDAGPFTIEELVQRNTTAGYHLSMGLERVE